MVARRIIAVSPDAAIRQQLATALAAATVAGDDAIDVQPSLGALGPGDLRAALCVIHLAGAAAATRASELLERLPGPCPIIVVLP
nr:hypothetical protein [Deltaproteobacteria bacterium]